MRYFISFEIKYLITEYEQKNLMNQTQISNEDNIGMVYLIISKFFIGFGTFWTKVV